VYTISRNCAYPGVGAIQENTGKLCLSWRCDLSWLTSMWGNDKTATKASDSLLNNGSWATGQGQSDVGKASNFFSSILSGDPSKISQTLSPEIGAAKTSAQQENKTKAEFGSRSGGKAASAAMTDDKLHSDIAGWTAALTGQAAETLGSMGSNLLQTGTSATTSGAQIDLANKPFWQQLLTSVGEGAGKAAGSAMAGG